MGGKWFSNRGQIVQLAAAILSLLTAWNAWGAIKTLDFLSLGPIIFYVSIATLVISFYLRANHKSEFSTPSAPAVQPATRTKAVADTSPRTPNAIAPPEPKWAASPTVQTFTLKAGAFFDGTHIRPELKITLKDITTATFKSHFILEETLEVSDIECRLGGLVVYGGKQTKEIDVNRFLVPAANGFLHSDERALYQLSFSNDHVSFFGLRVDHINMHAKEAVMTLCYQSAHFR